MCRRYRWIVGVSLACWINTSLDIVAFALAPLAVIAPIGALTIVVSVMLSRTSLAGKPESVLPIQWIAIFFVVFGVVLVDVYGPHPEPHFNTSQVLHQFHRSAFIEYQVASATMVIFTYTCLLSGYLGGSNIRTCLMSAIVGGLCSGITQTMMKVMATCAAAWLINNETPFSIAEFWIAASELIVVAFILLHMLNMCIQSASLAVATPIYQVNVILFTIIAGSAFYGDLAVVSRSELLAFVIGVTCVLCGLGTLIYNRRDEETLIPTYEKNQELAPTPTQAGVDSSISTCESVVDESSVSVRESGCESGCESAIR